MVARSDVPRLRERHIVDSLRAVPHLPASGTVCDLGSGAGLPGLVLAIARPDLHFVLVEVRRNRADFLQQAAEAIGLPDVAVYARRLATYRDVADACTARAFGSAVGSWAAADRLLGRSGFLIYWAGASFDAATDAPNGVSVHLFETPGLAQSGPLVIMARQ
jgi:16S rRNA (guanine527-N7)-methyltransferase